MEQNNVDAPKLKVEMSFKFADKTFKKLIDLSFVELGNKDILSDMYECAKMSLLVEYARKDMWDEFYEVKGIAKLPKKQAEVFQENYKRVYGIK